MGTKAVRVGIAQMTLHKVPLSSFKVGYLPKAKPVDLDLEKIYEVGKKENCISVKLDVPHTNENFKFQNSNFKLVPGKPVFAQSTFLLDLTKNDDELLSGMHEKTRYNLRLAQKKGVAVKIYSSPDEPGAKTALEEFIRLQRETARRQKFFVHPDHYYRTCFDVLSEKKMAYLIEAKISNSIAASWILFRYGDVLYYPYGESNYEYRSFMPSNLLMWEAIQLGKKLDCKVFDLWGAADDPNDESDPWHGFTRFKISFGATHVKLAKTCDLVINSYLYNLFNLGDKFRWKLLRLIK
ncbi:MAG: peptidoglycan bridge formation glycyltransferase FemA/FemB family protein [Patescibacteria group bacterium]|nr:peptidoglycan bridge formation glycyltransferase FemA/FemB family protein [Patescibacteria group bacterium]